MTLSLPSANVSLLDRYDCSLTSEGPELTRIPTFNGDIPPVEDINAGLTEELPVPGTKEERTCGTCGKDTIEYVKNQGPWVRCMICNADRAAVQYQLQRNEGLRKGWYGMRPSARREWKKSREAHLRGPDLANAMALHIEKSRPTCTQTKPGFQMSLRDSPELERVYRERAYLLKKVKSGATKVFDERRQCYLYEDYDYVGENTTQEVEATTTQLCAVSPCITKPYVMRAPKRKRRFRPLSEAAIQFERLKAKLDKARAAADAAIAEDEDEVVPPVVRKLLIQKNNELESMKTEIDIVANGDHSSLDTAGAKRKTMELVRTHKNTLMSFGRVRKSILKASDFE